MGYTKGPWRTGDMFGTVFGPPNGEPCPEVIATIHKKPGASDRNRANAQLIASAPQLLEALQEIHKLWCCPQPNKLKDWAALCDVMADYARQAIAKAEGK